MDEPEAKSSRNDSHTTKNRLTDVFGNIDDFYRTLSLSAGDLGRHGFVQPPATPVVPHSYGHPLGSCSPPTQQSARDCLMKMHDLVKSPPLQPPQMNHPLSYNKDFLNAEPSSSSRSTPDRRPKKRKKRHMDSDSEAEREKRKRDREQDVAQPSTSGVHNDQMRELFGEDDTKDDGGSTEKAAVSPDSGVHSTENDPGDENDVHSAQHILNIITRLSPPLSPIKERPVERKKDRKEREREERELERKRRKEKEKERKEIERKEAERKEAERKEAERKELEEKERLRKEKEEQEKKEAQAAEEKERERLLEEERERVRRREKKEREEKEAARKAKEAEKAREAAKARDAEKAAKEAREAEKARDAEKAAREAREAEKAKEKEKKAEARKNGTTSPEGGTRLKGELLLRALSPNKMNKLVEIGRVNGTLKKPEERSPSRSDSSNKEKKKKKKDKKEKEEKERKREKEGEKKKEKKDKVKEKERSGSGEKEHKSVSKVKEAKLESSTPSPRPGSSQSTSSLPAAVASSSHAKEFRCACNECLPSKSIRPEKHQGDEKPSDFYQNVAKQRKRAADSETDHLQRILMYFDSAVYFTLSAMHLMSTDRVGQRQISVVRDTCELLKVVTQHFVSKDSLSPLAQHYVSRVRTLSLRAQAVLTFNLYNFRSNSAFKTFSVLEQMESRVTVTKNDADADRGGAADGKTTPSPSSSVHSGSNQAGGATVSLPLDLYSCQKQQLKSLHYLMWAHRFWDDAALRSAKSQADTFFVNSLESICGHMCLNAPLDKMATFLLTGLSWLRAEYELERKRPPPPPVKRTS